MTEPAPPAAGPLSGVRILELGVLLAGPFAGRLLADLGAEVIKVEPPGQPDPLRVWGRVSAGGHGLLWRIQARNKKLITLNLRERAGQDVLRALVRRSDVLLENFRPGTLERWQLGPDRLWEANPELIIARVSGYGQTGPYAGRAGFASVAEAMGGLRHLNGFPGREPPRAGISLGDSLAGLFAAQGILAALYRREAGADRRGQVIDVSLVESCFALLEGAVPEYDALGSIRGPSGTALAGVAPSNIYLAADDRWMVIAANGDKVFRRLCEVMDRPELADDPDYADHRARGAHQEALDAEIASWVARHDSREIDAVLNAAGVVCGPIYTVADIVADPHYRARDMLVQHDDPELGSVLGPGVVPKFSRTPGAVRWTGPLAEGSHNDDVLRGLLGLDEATIGELARDGIV